MAGETRHDVLTPGLAERFAATFDRQPRAGPPPQGVHWCLCLPETATAALGVDGHAERADDTLPRRMWAASDIRFLAPIATGAAVTRESTIAATTEKQGSSGRLVFVDVDHVTRADGTIAIEERQTVVYRGAAAASRAPAVPPPRSAPIDWPWRRELVPSAPLLFRYSALTFNTHRIHYDLPYATGEEGYPGLVVHGPLMATLLLDLADRSLGPHRLARFRFRAVAPAFADAPLVLLGRPDGDAVTLEVRDDGGATLVAASATIAPA